MGAMKDLLQKSKAQHRRHASKGRSMKSVGTITYSDLGKSLRLVNKELINTVLPKCVDAIQTQVRKAAVRKVKSGGGKSSIGMSRITGTRKKWSAGTRAKRGENRPSMAVNGGKNGNMGIISKTSRRYKGWGITGPVYGADDKNNSRFGSNHAHTHEFGAKGHKWWGKKAKRALPARPFLGPAAQETQASQVIKLKKILRKWAKVG